LVELGDKLSRAPDKVEIDVTTADLFLLSVEAQHIVANTVNSRAPIVVLGEILKLIK